MIAYGDISWQEPQNTGFFQDVSLHGWQTPLGVKWHILAYLGILSPAKVVKKVVKLRGVPLGFYTIFD